MTRDASTGAKSSKSGAGRVGEALRARPESEPVWDAITHAVLDQYTGAEQAPKGWIDGVRLVTSAPALQGEYLKAQAVMRDVLAEAIAERVGADSEHAMLPRILADVVVTATEVATDRWLTAEQPTSATALVRQALRQLSDYLRLPSTPPQPADPREEDR